MQYAQVLATVARSAWSTLQILDRQAQRDTLKVVRFTIATYRFFTSSAACKRYAIIAQIIADLAAIAWMVCKATQKTLDEFVESCEQPVIVQPVAVEPETQPAILALPAPAQPIALLPAARLRHSIVPFRRPSQTVEPAWKSLTGEDRKRALRSACTAAGIQWRKRLSGGGTKCLTIAQMEARLTAQPA